MKGRMKRAASLIAFLFCMAGVYAQTDSIGVYSVSGNGIEKVNLSTPISNKVRSAFFSAKTVTEFSGATSSTRFQGKATFRLYYRAPTEYEAVKYYIFAPSSSPDELAIARLDVKKKSRYLSGNRMYAFVGGTIGAKRAKDVDVEIKQLRPGVYELTVSGPPGEYCILPLVNGIATPYPGVFAFTIQ